MEPSQHPRPLTSPQESDSDKVVQTNMQASASVQKSGLIIVAQIISLSEPFTFSATIKVEIQEYTEPLVINLYDRRLPAMSGLCKSFKMKS
jgi:hypothetical protein